VFFFLAGIAEKKGKKWINNESVPIKNGLGLKEKWRRGGQGDFGHYFLYFF